MGLDKATENIRIRNANWMSNRTIRPREGADSER